MMIPPIIGVKVAVSDHRSSNPTGEELIRLATAARRAGLLSCNPGLVTMHMGSGQGGLDPVFYVLDHADVPAKNLLPTHMHRTQSLLEQGLQLVRRGGYIDITAGSVGPELAEVGEKLLWTLSQPGITPDHVNLSSDAYGSQPRFDGAGNCVGLTYASPNSLHGTIRYLVSHGMALEEALKLLTTTPAQLIAKEGVKGCIAPGADADLLVLGENLSIEGLFARGKTARWAGETQMRGKFE